MSTALQLEKKLQILTDEVHDIFHATGLNIEALRVQAQHKNMPSQIKQVVKECSISLSELENLLKERSTLRLNYLITQQIKEQQGKVRRQRLNDYEEKILDQRRLINDKQAFYENLLRPKKKRPPNMPLEEFQDLRRRQISEQENRKFNMLKQQITRLSQFHQLIKSQNDRIKDKIEQAELPEGMQQRTDLTDQIQKNQTLFNSLNEELSTSDLGACANIFKAIQQAKTQNEHLFKEYEEQKQMQQYLKWEKQKLIKQYQQVKNQLKGCREKKVKKVPIFNRPVSR